MTKLSSWRFIPLLSTDGRTQMSIDSWLLSQHQYDHQPSSLRFYLWNPVAISLGVSQKRKIPSRWQNLHYQGQKIELVKRPTGGRGVLHQGDLTYSLVTSNCSGNYEQIYRHLCQFLILGWQNLGVNLYFGQPQRQYLQSDNCFALATNADLVDGKGNKFIGSAQLRRGKYILQHGSMILNPDVDLYRQVFNCSPSRANIDRSISIDTIVTTLAQAAEEYFNCKLIYQPLSVAEFVEINHLNGQ